MSDNKGNAGQGKNQSGTPRQAAAPGPIIQPGEDAAAMAAVTQDLNIPRLGASMQPVTEAAAPAPAPAPMQQQVASSMSLPQPTASAAAAPVPMGEPASLAEFQKQYDAAAAKAKNNPVLMHRMLEAGQSTAAAQIIDIPTAGNVGDMSRSDLLVETADPFNMDHAAMMAFLEEMLIINIHETSDITDDNPVPIGNNGRMVYIKRGVNTLVKRKYVEQLLRAKPQSVSTTVVRQGDNVQNRVTKRSAMRYPFTIVRDDNPLGAAWMRKTLSEV